MSLKCNTNMLFHSSHYSLEMVVKISKIPDLTNLHSTSPSVSVASRRITPSQRPLRALCSLVFGATRLKETTKQIIFEISMLDYPIWSLESS